MKKLVVGTFLTLDGIMQAPGGSEEDTESGFKHGGWQMPLFDDDAGKIIDGQIASTDALLLGRVTYQIFASYWPTAPADDPVARKLNSMPKYVASTTLKNVEWANSTLIKGNLVEEVNKLKQQPGSGILSVIGSGKLAQSLMQHDLVDDYVLLFHPIVLGTGKRLFEGGVPAFDLKLVDTQTTGSGIVILTIDLQRNRAKRFHTRRNHHER
jgi:dihydrofolate reductase